MNITELIFRRPFGELHLARDGTFLAVMQVHTDETPFRYCGGEIAHCRINPQAGTEQSAMLELRASPSQDEPARFELNALESRLVSALLEYAP